jgi:hypothetical protein
MTRDNDVKRVLIHPGGKLVHIVQDVDPDARTPQEEPQRQLIGPGPSIVVAAYRMHRRYSAQACDYRGSPDVARMNDLGNARERLQRFGSQQTMRIRDQSDPVHSPILYCRADTPAKRGPRSLIGTRRHHVTVPVAHTW